MSKWTDIQHYEKTGFWNAEKTTPQWVQDIWNTCRSRCYPIPHHDQFKAVAAEEEIARLNAELGVLKKKIDESDAFFKTLTENDKTIVKLESELAQRDERILILDEFRKQTAAIEPGPYKEDWVEALSELPKKARELGVKEKS